MAGIRTVSRCGATRLRLGFDRVGVQNPLVEMDRDEMTRIIWRMIKRETYISIFGFG
jgi:hypothetical protein